MVLIYDDIYIDDNYIIDYYYFNIYLSSDGYHNMEDYL